MKKIIKALVFGSLISLQAQANSANNISYEELLPQYISWAVATDHEGM